MALEDYVKMSERRTFSLNSEKRKIIYRIFQVYEKMKLERKEYDTADFVMDIHSRFQAEVYRGDELDCVYVDEVQDRSITEITLLKCVCNKTEGFVFGGDTTQAIARGIDFRFQEIQATFYKKFIDARKESTLELFQLTRNFRCSSGMCCGLLSCFLASPSHRAFFCVQVFV